MSAGKRSCPDLICYLLSVILHIVESAVSRVRPDATWSYHGRRCLGYVDALLAAWLECCANLFTSQSRGGRRERTLSSIVSLGESWLLVCRCEAVG